MTRIFRFCLISVLLPRSAQPECSRCPLSFTCSSWSVWARKLTHWFQKKTSFLILLHKIHFYTYRISANATPILWLYNIHVKWLSFCLDMQAFISSVTNFVIFNHIFVKRNEFLQDHPHTNRPTVAGIVSCHNFPHLGGCKMSWLKVFPILQIVIIQLQVVINHCFLVIFHEENLYFPGQ